MILAEAHRRLGDKHLAIEAWQQTAALAARVAPRWLEPALWEQIAGERPGATPWTPEVGPALAPLLPESLRQLSTKPAFAAESLVWFAIGHARLERTEAAAALTAFKQADSRGNFPEWDEFLTLHQAKALLTLGKTPEAASLLTALTNRPGALAWRSPALAL